MDIAQVGGRALVLFGLLAVEPRLQDKEPVMWLFLTWSTIELIRSLLAICCFKRCGNSGIFIVLSYFCPSDII